MWGLSIISCGSSPEFSTFAPLCNYSIKSYQFPILDEMQLLIISLEIKGDLHLPRLTILWQ